MPATYDAELPIGTMIGGVEMVTHEQLREAIAAERERCAKICADADKSTHPSDLADLIRKSGTR